MCIYVRSTVLWFDLRTHLETITVIELVNASNAYIVNVCVCVVRTLEISSTAHFKHTVRYY